MENNDSNSDMAINDSNSDMDNNDSNTDMDNNDSNTDMEKTNSSSDIGWQQVRFEALHGVDLILVSLQVQQPFSSGRSITSEKNLLFLEPSFLPA